MATIAVQFLVSSKMWRTQEVAETMTTYPLLGQQVMLTNRAWQSISPFWPGSTFWQNLHLRLHRTFAKFLVYRTSSLADCSRAIHLKHTSKPMSWRVSRRCRGVGHLRETEVDWRAGNNNTGCDRLRCLYPSQSGQAGQKVKTCLGSRYTAGGVPRQCQLGAEDRAAKLTWTKAQQHQQAQQFYNNNNNLNHA